MTDRLRKLGIVMVVFGVVFAVSGVFAFTQVQAGNASLQTFSEAQNVTLQYNEDGVIISRGSVERGAATLSLLENDWGYRVVMRDLNPDDPVVNTATEYMFMMAMIGYNVLNSTQTIVLDEAVEFNGETFAAGVHEFAVDGRYWTDFDRMHPIEGPARGQAWSGTVHGLFGQLGVGTVTASVLQLALGVSALLFGLGATIVLLGAGLVWVARTEEDDLIPVVVDKDPEPTPTNI